MPGYKTPPAATVNTIKNLLKERYKQGFPIIKEIIQNANDGQATTLDFGVVKGLGDSVNHPLLKTPALFFLNNGTFSKSDREAISCFGIDANAKDRGKIGKFGLGQKSVFHFCEAFFYIARSNDIQNGCGEFINPWATSEGKDSKRPDWTELSDKDRHSLENYLFTYHLVTPENPRYFLLWIPLRQKMADERCILANYYNDANSVQDSLPADMEIRIGQILPLLRYLRSIRYFVENNSGSLERKFSVSLDEQNLIERFIHPDASSQELDFNEHDLQGRIRVSSDKSGVTFAGKERVLAANDFALLLGQSPDSISNNFWQNLQQSSFWSKRYSINEDAEQETVPDKSIPHCAVVFTKQSLGGRHKARLIVQWSVFLPLASDDNNSSIEEAEREAYQLIECSGDKNYTIFLHGYFFLDSGRKYIEGLQNIRNGFIPKTPENEDEMIAQWNYLLTTKGTLKLFLPSLQHFCETQSLSDKDISNLCQAISHSQLFKSKVYKQSVCAEYQWVFRTHPSHSSWELIPMNASLRSLPAIPPNWQEFPKLQELAKQHYFILLEEPNLLLAETSTKWDRTEVCSVLNSLNPSSIFSNSNYLGYLVNFLEEQKNIVKQPDIQASLINLLRQAFITIEISILQKESLFPLIQKLISQLNADKRLRISEIKAEEPTLINNVLKELYPLQLDIFLVYQPFEVLQPSKGVLSSEEIVSILNCLSNLLRTEPSYRKIIQEMIQQFLNHAKPLDFVLNRLANIPLFVGYNHCGETTDVYSYLTLQELHKKSCLFQGKGNTALATALNEALPNTDLIFIDRKLAQSLGNTSSLKNIPECNANSCLQLLATQPDLANAVQRTNLLKELINHV